MKARISPTSEPRVTRVASAFSLSYVQRVLRSSLPVVVGIAMCACAPPPDQARDQADGGAPIDAIDASDGGGDAHDDDDDGAPDTDPVDDGDAGAPDTDPVDAGADGGGESGTVDAGSSGAPIDEVDCGTFPAVSDVTQSGPFAFTSEDDGPNCTIVHPTNLGDGGVRHPVILWGNGTDAPVSLYKPAFEYWASYGFIVAAADVVDGQGLGQPQLACLDWVLAQNHTAGSPFEDKVCPRVAATGHSQGGAGAIMAGTDPRVAVTAPLMAYTQQDWGGFDTASITTQVASPMLLLSGTLDNNATPSIYQQPVFDTTNVPVFWGNLIGADHYTAALGLTKYRAPMLEWFRLHLMDDESFRGVFYGDDCSLCGDNHWIVQRHGL